MNDASTLLRPLALVGMPGAGKSTAGRQLARQLNLGFVDSDHEIETRVGCSIRTFFAEQGEEAFRAMEAEVLAQLASGAPRVIATGGGVVLREANREVLQRYCTVFYLQAAPEELFRRLRHDTQRPLLQVPDPQQRLRDLYGERDPLYRQTAHFVIETGRPSVSGLVDMVLMQLEAAGLLAPARPTRPARPPAP